MRKLIAILILLTLTGAPATPWTLASCGADNETSWQAFEKAVREAKPGSPIYVPKPFPRDEAEIVEDFVYQLTSILPSSAHDSTTSDEDQVLDSIRSGEARFEILKVTNWTPLRCAEKRKREYYYLLRIYDPETKVEIARAAMNYDGLFEKMQFSNTRTESLPLRPMAELQAAARDVSTLHAVTLGDAQYITTWGTLRCDLLDPCVSFRRQNEVYIFKDLRLYRAHVGGARYSLSRDLKVSADPVQIQERARILAGMSQRGELLISLGDDTMLAVTAIEP